MTTPFQQPAWTPDNGPWPGAETAAAAIAEDAAALDLAALADHEKRRIQARRKAEHAADTEDEAARRIIAVRGSDITVRRTLWIWRDRVPAGGLALMAGKGDVSKSTLFAQMCAWITLGDMKGEYYGQPRDVAYVVNEDSLHETVVPRMIAHGADMQRIHFLTVQSPIGEDALSLPRDADLLRQFIRENEVIATFIDPLSANVTGRKNDQGDMRATFQQVNRIAEDTRTAIIGLAHTRKAGAGDVMEAIMGSSEQGNVARSVHGLVMDPEEDGARILSCEKLNVGQKSALASLRFTLDSVYVPCTDGTGDTTSMPRIRWLEETTDSASDILGDQLNGNVGSGIEECVLWMDSYLLAEGGEAYAADVQGAAGKKFSASMLARARRRLGVTTCRSREPHARTVWTHPSNTQDAME